MTEEAPGRAEPFKIWRNPEDRSEPIAYMGDYYPPNGRVAFVPQDLVDLGFAPGEYTIRVPASLRRSGLIAKWQKLRVER
jgi:hypothetical protein